ncbi:MAG: ABC-F family ATP-binding cassette domain-containing protein [Chloroflexi bacterium]|nr:ABC-F family ATP-binding cassette domain-containing protein [Chloroflexota bacterium]
MRRLSRDLVAIEEMGISPTRQSRKWSETGVGSSSALTVAEAEAAIKGFSSPGNQRLPKLAARQNQLTAAATGCCVPVIRKWATRTSRLFGADDMLLVRAECAALIGDNGTGKPPCSKRSRGKSSRSAGTSPSGSGLKVGYFAQAHDQLILENTVLDELLRHKYMLLSEARKHLAQYLFRADDVYKKVGMLSGGERGKLALAILTLDRANFLLLDEPTNHLDIPAQEILQEVLEQFDGTILLVRTTAT